MTSYDGYVATPKDPNFDWRAGDGATLQDLELTVHAASGLEAMLALMRAIEDGRLEGRQLDWGAWIAPIEAGRLEVVMTDLGWPVTPDLDQLDASRSWYLVAVET